MIKQLCVFAISFLLSFGAKPVMAAGIPTTDVINNLSQQLQLMELLGANTQRAEQLLNEVRQIDNQVRQIENQIQSLKQLGSYSWADYNEFVKGLTHAVHSANRLAASNTELLSAFREYKTLDEYIMGGNIDQQTMDWHTRVSNDTQNLIRDHAENNNKHAKRIIADAAVMNKHSQMAENINGQVEGIQVLAQQQDMTNKQLGELRQLLIAQEQRELQKRAEEAEEKAIAQAKHQAASGYKKTTNYEKF